MVGRQRTQHNEMSDIQSTQMLTTSEQINSDIIQEQTVVPHRKVTLAPTNTHELWSLEINSSSCHLQRLTRMLLRGMPTRIYWAEMNPPRHVPQCHLSLQKAPAPRVMLWLISLKWPRTKQPHGLSAKCWSVGQKATLPAGIPVCAGKHQHRGQSAPGWCFGGRAAAKHLSLLWKVDAGLGVCSRDLTERQLS